LSHSRSSAGKGNERTRNIMMLWESLAKVRKIVDMGPIWSSIRGVGVTALVNHFSESFHLAFGSMNARLPDHIVTGGDRPLTSWANGL
jgi:hypothetical protein